MLEERFQQAEGLVFSVLEREGYTLRTATLTPPNAQATIIIAMGLSECIEKYYETMRGLHAAGMTCAIIDWRGQGASSRYYKNRHKRGSTGFQNDVNDLLAFIDTLSDQDMPRFLLGHSMGAHIATRALALRPDLVQKAAFSAPMYGIAMPVIGQKMARKLAAGLYHSPLKHAYVPGHGDWCANAVAKPFLTRDPRRAAIQSHWFKTRPDLQIGGVSWSWLHHAMQSCKALQTMAGAVTTPCLIGVAECDKVVCNATIQDVAATLPTHRIITLKDSAHEILMERDRIRDRFLSEAMRFFTG